MDELIKALRNDVNHVKFDVDGNEFLVLQGGGETFRSPSLKSVLIELDYENIEYKSAVELIESYGFKLKNIASESHKRIRGNF